MEKIVYIPVETKKRELTAKLILSAELVNRGYRVVVGNPEPIRKRYAAHGPAGFYFEKDYCSYNEKCWQRLKDNGCMILASDEEGLVYFSDEIYKSRRCGEKTIEMCDVIFGWGSEQERLTCEVVPSAAERIHRTANPRVDILKGLPIFYKDKIEKHKRDYGKYVLFNSHFARPYTDEYFQQYFGHMPGDMQRAIRYEEKARVILADMLMDALKELSKNIPYTIIVRPHPSPLGYDQEFVDAFKDYPNIVVTGEGDANEWIAGCSAMIHCGCSTAYEAYMAGIPSILYKPDNTGSVVAQDFPNLLSERIGDPQTLISRVTEYVEHPDEVKKEFFTPQKDAFFTKYIDLNGHKYSARAMADVIDSINAAPSTSKIESMKTIKRQIHIWLERYVFSLKKKVREDKFALTSKTEIRKTLASACELLEIAPDIKVKELEWNLFLLEKNRMP